MILKKNSVLVWLVCATAGMVLTGCVTRKGPQFEPLPLPEVGVGELEPVKPSSTTELLRAAEKEFKDANAAQEKGDKEAALRHYNKMLQLLIDANLDPVIFYNLRREFSRILDSTAQQTIFFERRTPYQWPDGGKAMPMVMGDLPIPFPLPPRVIQEINEIREVYPRGFQTGLNRSFQYAPYIRAKLAEAGLPQDLFWLAIVESWFNPRAYSRAGAAGMWQFMKDTGRRYGLRIDNYVDERYNWERSTDAAIAYLKDLYAEFGEWPVAIAAYNMGEGGMERAVAAAGGERDIWKLLESPGARLMQEETQKFYPKLVASIIVASSPESYGFTLNPIPPQDYIRVPVEGSYSLAELEKSCGLAEGSLKELNPDLIRGYTPPTGEYPVAVPTHAHTMFLAALETVPKHTTSLWALLGGTESSSEKESPPRSSTTTYVVKRGDTLSKIASNFGVPVADLMAANKITSSKGLFVGKRLIIPKTAGSPEQMATAAADKSSAQNPPSTQTSEPSPSLPAPAERQTYRVQKGDTLAEIAQKFKVSVQDIQTWNNLSNKSHIRINDVLYVSPPPASAKAEPQGEKKIHVVKPGETLSTIASAYNVPLDDLLKWNNLTQKSLIRANDKLTIYAKADANSASKAAAPTTKSEPQTPSQEAAQQSGSVETKSGADTYTVVSGDTAAKIAQKHGISLADFLKWNNLKEKSVLQVGQKCRVKPLAQTTSAEQPTAAAPPDKPETPTTSKQAAPVAGEGEKKTYRVEAGENPARIAKKLGVHTVDLLKWNGWEPTRILKAGEEYVVYVKPENQKPADEKTSAVSAPQTATPAPTGEPVIHKVKSGQNPTTIAKQYNVSVKELFQWNNWEKDHVLQVGDSVKVYPKK